MKMHIVAYGFNPDTVGLNTTLPVGGTLSSTSPSPALEDWFTPGATWDLVNGVDPTPVVSNLNATWVNTGGMQIDPGVSYSFTNPNTEFFGPYTHIGLNPTVVSGDDYVAPSLTVENAAKIGQLILGEAIDPPVSAFGAFGDAVGMIRTDESNVYVCTANYTDGSHPIWKSMSLNSFNKKQASAKVASVMGSPLGLPGDEEGDIKVIHQPADPSAIKLYMCVRDYTPENTSDIWIEIPTGSGGGSSGIRPNKTTAIGDGAHGHATAGSNTAFGYHALAEPTGSTQTGYPDAGLTAIGCESMEHTPNTYVINGNYCTYTTSVGYRSANQLQSGMSNVVVGAFALHDAAVAYYNVAVGKDAMKNASSGIGSNVAVGHTSMQFTQSSNSTAVGSESMSQGGGGVNTSAFGYRSLRYLTTGMNNTAVGANSLENATTSGVATAIGYRAGWGIVGGGGNVAVGYVMKGESSSRVTTGTCNVGIGYDILDRLTTGENNYVMGAWSAQYLSDGSFNIVVGSHSLENATNVNNNIAIGSYVMQNATYGNNIAIGNFSQMRVAGQHNVSLGNDALKNLEDGSYNIAVGFFSMRNASSGMSNTIIGGNEDSISTGSRNVMLSSPLQTPVYQPYDDNDRIVIGHTGSTNAYVPVAWTVVSDERDKTNINPISIGIEFVKKLNPVSYQYRINRQSEEPRGPVRYGFRAQDILELEGQTPVIVDVEDPTSLKITDQSIIAVLVKAIQDQQLQIEALQESINNIQHSQE